MYSSKKGHIWCYVIFVTEFFLHSFDFLMSLVLLGNSSHYGRLIWITLIMDNSNTKSIMSEVQKHFSQFYFCYFYFVIFPHIYNTMFTVYSHMWKLFMAMANRPLPIFKTCKATLF